MPIIKCKNCGGDIELTADKTFGTCEYCGSAMTLPRIDDDQRAAAFNRGNHFRRQGEFDKALAVYERIVAEDDTDAEAHWCCALCRFGIEYVEDPATYEWLPTCHRASFDSFLEDVDYLAALENSDGITKRQYQKDAAKIAEVQRGILATSQNEEPFDVFICYKESEENGERIRDSILAQEIYYQLTEQGRRVFFARITLEDKAGTEYEPYIFAALNSAKVMVAVGTTAEHFNAVWVKNEWSRFLALMRKDRKKLLLPCYRDMDPYDLPEQLSVLQSYDMAKIGFIQDLTRGISRVLDADKQAVPQQMKETVVVQQTAAGSTTEAAQLERGMMALEDGDWEKADGFFEEALNLNPKSAEAYLGKLLAKTKVANLNGFVAFYRKETSYVESEILTACPEDTARLERAKREYVIPDYNEESAFMPAYVYDCTYFSELSARKEQKRNILAGLNANKILARVKNFASGETKTAVDKALAEIIKLLDDRIASAQAADEKKIEEIKQAYAAHLDHCDATAAEMKQAKESLKAEIASIEKQLAEIDAGNYTLSGEQAKEYASLKEKEEQAKQAYDTAKAELAAMPEHAEIKRIDGLISEKTERLAKLGIFKGKEKKALQEQLDALHASKADAERKIHEKEASVEKLQAAVQAATETTNFLSRNIKVGLLQQLIRLTGDPGVTVRFGEYKQQNTSDEKEAVEWDVLAVEGGRALLVSHYALDCRRYNNEYVDVTWETCSLRKWLNESFINDAFSEKEKAMIAETTVTADKNRIFNTPPGNNTNDKVFLLSITEVEKYFDSDEARKCVPTAYAIANGAYTDDEYTVGSEGTCWWWLRSPGGSSQCAADVTDAGRVSAFGYVVHGDCHCIRPALWINLES